MESSRGQRSRQNFAAGRIVVYNQNRSAVIIEHVLLGFGYEAPTAVYFLPLSGAGASSNRCQGLHLAIGNRGTMNRNESLSSKLL